MYVDVVNKLRNSERKKDPSRNIPSGSHLVLPLPCCDAARGLSLDASNSFQNSGE